MTALRRYAAYTIVCISGLLLLAILASLLLIFVGIDMDASMESDVGTDAITGFVQQSLLPRISSILFTQMAVLRSYLFRHALRNTLIVLVFALPMALGLGFAGVALVRQSRRSSRAMVWLLLLPLAMPVALTMPAWRQIFAPTLALAGEDVWPSLLAVAFIQAWRLLPFASLFLLLDWPLHRRSPAIGLTFCFSAYFVLSEISVLLLLTGGAPFNGTHLLTSWIYHTGIAARMSMQAASMTLVLIPMLFSSVWGIVHFAGRLTAVAEHGTGKRRLRNPAREDDPTNSPRRVDNPRQTGSPEEPLVEAANSSSVPSTDSLLAAVAMIVLLLPLSVVLIKSAPLTEWPNALLRLFGQTDYPYWLANTVLSSCLIALATVLVAIPVGSQLAACTSPWASRLAVVLGMLGMCALPVSFMPLSVLQAAQHFGDGRWLLLLIYTSAGICVGVWLVALSIRGSRPTRQTSVARWLVLLSFTLATHEMAAALTLSNGRSQTQGLGTGMASRLLFDPAISSTAASLAILLPTVLLLLFYRRLLQGSVAELAASANEGERPQLNADVGVFDMK